MTEQGLIAMTIDHYGDLQRIKQANGTQENPTLEYILKVTALKLSVFGVNIEDVTL